MQVLDHVPDGFREVLSDGLRDYGLGHAGESGRTPLAVPLPDPVTGQTVGGLVGRTIHGMLVIELIYIPEHLRRQDWGTRLLDAATDEARRRGCTYAYLDTMNFQAPRFYAGLGWEEFGHVPGSPGITRIFFRKAL